MQPVVDGFSGRTGSGGKRGQGRAQMGLGLRVPLKFHVGERLTVPVPDGEAPSCSSTDQGGGKLRTGIGLSLVT
jgi:hypothetical protein